MNWDEKAEDEIDARGPLAYHDPGYSSGFNSGAKWQRDQLRTDEAVERLLLALHPTIDSIRDDHPDVVERAKAHARALITALIGEEP